MSTNNADGSSSLNSPHRGGRGSDSVTEDVTGSASRSGGVGVAGNVAPPPRVGAVENAPPPPPPPAQPQQNHICSVCERRFNSRQALFGHMRIHGSRGWRGAFPPPVFNRGEFADVLPLLANAAGEDADAQPPPAYNAPPAQPEALPDLNEHQYCVPDLNFPPPPA